MSQESPVRPRRHSTGLWVVIIVLLIPPVVLPLWVPLYDKTDPKLWGFPFFYWFQFALILFSAVMTIAAFLLSRVADRKDREGTHQGVGR
jgi:membrane protein implicated in regulation of membrane protease activity